MNRESYIISCIRRLREYGQGIVLADQCISTIKDVVKSNTYTIIGMNQTGQKDRREMVNVLGLDSNQAKTINFLDVGQGIVRLAGRFPFPQIIIFPFIQPKNFSEKQLDEYNSKDQRINELLGMVKLAKTGNPPSLDTEQSIPKYTEESKTKQMPARTNDMLLDIFNRFDVASTARSKDFELSASAADKIFKHLEREQLVDVVKLNLTGGRGKTSKFYVPTDPKGYETISKTPPKKSGGTGATHYFLERYLKKHLPAKGFTELSIEKNIEGKRIDLFGKYGDLKIAIEICCTTIKTEYLNVLKDIDKCDFVIIATPDKKTKIKLDNELSKKLEPTKKLKTCVVHELINHPEKLIR